jgi:hypothetical protein
LQHWVRKKRGFEVCLSDCANRPAAFSRPARALRAEGCAPCGPPRPWEHNRKPWGCSDRKPKVMKKDLHMPNRRACVVCWLVNRGTHCFFLCWGSELEA